MVTCADLQEFFDGEMDRAKAAAFRDHVADCQRCQDDLERAMQLVVASLTKDPNTTCQ